MDVKISLKRKLEDLGHNTERQRVVKDPNKFTDIIDIRLVARKPEEA